MRVYITGFPKNGLMTGQENIRLAKLMAWIWHE